MVFAGPSGRRTRTQARLQANVLAHRERPGHLAVDAIEEIVWLNLCQGTLAGAEPSPLLLLPRASVGFCFVEFEPHVPAAAASPRDTVYAVRPCRGCRDLRHVVRPQRVPPQLVVKLQRAECRGGECGRRKHHRHSCSPPPAKQIDDEQDHANRNHRDNRKDRQQQPRRREKTSRAEKDGRQYGDDP
jgi:hypothetical protein